jgi:hypothetical protein
MRWDEDAVSGHILACLRCGRRELEPGEEWVALLVDDEVRLFCPACAERERKRPAG